jgi:hypothetical protein
MTIEEAPAELLDLALELVYAGDAENLTHALAIAEDLNTTLEPYAAAWDAQCAAPADDVIADYLDTKQRAQQWLEGYRRGLGLDL